VLGLRQRQLFKARVRWRMEARTFAENLAETRFLIHPGQRVELRSESALNNGAIMIQSTSSPSRGEPHGVQFHPSSGRAGRDPKCATRTGTVVATYPGGERRSRDDEPDWFNLEIWGSRHRWPPD